MASVACKTCSRIYTIRDETPLKSDIQFCPTCGSSKIIISDKKVDYWVILSDITGVHPEILRNLFVVWDIDEYPRFLDFINSIKEKVA